MTTKHAPDVSIGANVATLRRQHGLTQGEVAKRLGVEHAQVISSIEKGERALKAVELSRLARILNVSPLELLGVADKGEQPFVLWREVKDDSVRRSEEQQFLLRCRRYAFLEGLSNLTTPAFSMSAALDVSGGNFRHAKRSADEIRKRLGLGDMPAVSLQNVLENRFGVKIFVSPLRSGSGACTRGEFGPAVLLNRVETAERRAFTLAHELFHLLTWERAQSVAYDPSQPCWKMNEQMAGVFASSLLLPAEPLLNRIAELGAKPYRYPDLVEVACEFGVSLAALAWRLANLALLEENTARELASRPAKAPGGHPRGETSSPLPRRFVTLAFAAYAEKKISVGKLAELLESTVGLLPRELAGFDLSLDIDACKAQAVPAGRRNRHRAP